MSASKLLASVKLYLSCTIWISHNLSGNEHNLFSNRVCHHYCSYNISCVG